MSRKIYASEFKEEAVRLAEQGSKSTAQVVRDLGVNVELLRRWVREFGTKKNGKDVITPSEHDELIILRRKLRQIAEEHEILKKPSVSSRRNCRKIPVHQRAGKAIPRKSYVQDIESIWERVLRVVNIW
ncbi:MAG: transposase [Armatimonadota bacterium]